MQLLSRVIIESCLENGLPFRPSDWIERLSATVAQFGRDHRLHYQQDLRPAMIDGTRCLILSEELRRTHPHVYEWVLEFAVSNGLRIRREA